MMTVLELLEVMARMAWRAFLTWLRVEQPGWTALAERFARHLEPA